jgi:CRP-like cAMP-binding protein
VLARRIPMFCEDSITMEDRRRWLCSCELVSFGFGDKVVTRGHVMTSVFVVLSGTLEVIRPSAAGALLMRQRKAASESKKPVVCELQKGRVVGEYEWLRQQSSATVFTWYVGVLSVLFESVLAGCNLW